MQRTILNYLSGILLFLVFPCGLVVLAILMLLRLTGNFSRSALEDNFLLILFLLMVSAVLIPAVSLYIFSKLRKTGNSEVANGMVLGLVLLLTYTSINKKKIEQAEARLEIENEARNQADYKARQRLEAEITETRNQLVKDAAGPDSTNLVGE